MSNEHEQNVTANDVAKACGDKRVTTRYNEKGEAAKKRLKAIEERMVDVKPDKQAVYIELQRLSRGPFRDILADFLSCAPSEADIRHAATKSPDRWAQAVAIIAKLSGYHERLEVEGVARVTQLSDAEIEAKLAELIDARAKEVTGEAKAQDQES